MLGRPSFVVERVRTLFFQLIYADQASEEAAAAQNYFVSPPFPAFLPFPPLLFLRSLPALPDFPSFPQTISSL